MDYKIQNGDTMPGVTHGKRKEVPTKSTSEKEKGSAAEQLRTLLKLNPLTTTIYYALNPEELKKDLNTLNEADENMPPVVQQIGGLLNPVQGFVNAVKNLYSRD